MHQPPPARLRPCPPLHHHARVKTLRSHFASRLSPLPLMSYLLFFLRPTLLNPLLHRDQCTAPLDMLYVMLEWQEEKGVLVPGEAVWVWREPRYASSQVSVDGVLKDAYNPFRSSWFLLNLTCHSVDTSEAGCEKHTPAHCAGCPFELLMTSHPWTRCEFHFLPHVGVSWYIKLIRLIGSSHTCTTHKSAPQMGSSLIGIYRDFLTV